MVSGEPPTTRIQPLPSYVTCVYEVEVTFTGNGRDEILYTVYTDGEWRPNCFCILANP